jgi:RHS repeat-associated protein
VLANDGSGTTKSGFTGEWTDASNLQYLRARYYAPSQGRLLTADTWAGNYRQPLTLNKWLYTNGNPVNFTDPSGRFAETPLDVFFIGYDIAALTIDLGMWAFGPESQRNQWAGQAGIDTGALLMDLLFAATPGATGGGMMFRGLVGLGRAAAITCGVSADVIRAGQAVYKGAQIAGRYGPLMHLMGGEDPMGGGSRGSSRGGGGGGKSGRVKVYSPRGFGNSCRGIDG